MIFLDSLIAWLLVAAVFVPLERLFTLRHEQHIFRKLWHLDLTYVAINGFVITIGVSILLYGGLYVSSLAVPVSFQEWVGSLPFWVQLPALIILSDLGFYAVHRLFHAVPWLWKFHSVHHSIEEMDWLAAYRIHPFDQIVTKGASLLPVLILGFSPAAIAVYSFLYRWQTLLIHANVTIDFGPLNRIFASPRFHHWHHANNKEAYDKNFAAQLSFLDSLFGTCHMPAGEMPKRYGIDQPVPPYYVAQLIFPFLGKPAQEKMIAESQPALPEQQKV